MRQILTLKQRLFAAAWIGPAMGNQTRAARMAGYRGDDRQLAVQGSVNMKNPKIQEMMIERLSPLLEPSMKAYAEGLVATRRRAFLTQKGEIVYSSPEIDHRVRVGTADRILDRYERLSARQAAGPDADDTVQQRSQDGTEPEKEVAGLDPTDRNPISRSSEMDEKLAEIAQQMPPQDRRLVCSVIEKKQALDRLEGYGVDSKPATIDAESIPPQG